MTATRKYEPILMYGRFLSILDTAELFTFACSSCHSQRVNNPSGKIYPNCSKCRVHNLRAGLPPLKSMFDEYGRPNSLNEQFTMDFVMRVVTHRFEQICASYTDDDIQDALATALGRFVSENSLPRPTPTVNV